MGAQNPDRFRRALRLSLIGAGMLVLALSIFSWLEQEKQISLSEQHWRSRVMKALRPNKSLQNSENQKTRAPANLETEVGKVENFLQKEAPAIAQLDTHPEGTEQKLFDFSQSLSAEGFAQLRAVALDFRRQGDERFLSVYLLSKASSTAVEAELMAIAEAPLPKEKMDSRLYDQEIIIRTQALEGIAHMDDRQRAKEKLKEYLVRQDNVSLSGQAHRLLQDISRK